MERLLKSKIRVPGLEVRVLERCTSTNTVLRDECEGGRAFHGASAVLHGASAVLLAAEKQTAGRGRHGRRWRSAPGAGATFSLRRPMACAQRRLAGLSIAVGVSTARALRRLGARGVSVKWPNDLMWNHRKLGGILIETRPLPRPDTRPLPRPDTRPLPSSDAGLHARGSVVIVGIGINCRAQPRLGARLGRGVAALDEVLRRPILRSAVIGAVAREVLVALEAWERAWPALELAA